MKAKGLFTILATTFLALTAPKTANAISLQQAKNVADSVYSRHVGNNYLHEGNFWDGTNQRIAYALARSGDTLSGGCGRVFVNYNNLAVTFDMATDSSGAYEEGITVSKIDTSAFQTIQEIHEHLENFWYINDLGSANGVNGEQTEQQKPKSPIKHYPNPVKKNSILNVIGLKPNSSFTIENILGQRVYSSSANDKGEYHSNSLFNCNNFSRGIYFLRGIDQKTNKPGNVKIIIN